MKTLTFVYKSTLLSYAQVFFSGKLSFAWLILIASFLSYPAGMGGLLAVLITNLMAWWWGLPKAQIAGGTYSFNSLLVGLAIGGAFEMNTAFWLLLIAASLLTLFLTVISANFLANYGLPFLSLPFTLAMWIVLLSIKGYKSLEISTEGVYFINQLYFIGGIKLVKWYEWFNDLPIPIFFSSYLQSLGAIVFQQNTFAGLILAFGLLLHSRIAFTLSLLGYSVGYGFYTLLGGDLGQLHYFNVGFNFILSTISLGGFFLVPSRFSYLLSALVTPIIALLIGSLGVALAPYGLPVFALPFTLVVIITLYALKGLYFTEKNFWQLKLKEVVYQTHSPEKNLYYFLNEQNYQQQLSFWHLALPFFGTWKVAQGHNGDFTHKGEWQYAWDFVVTDENDSTHQNEGHQLADYYCYGLPVVAPADGWVYAVIDGLEDNEIGEVDLQNNWGNSLIIKHFEGFYTKLSHLKKGSFSIREGDYVYKGQTVAKLGNSGRSPEPHLHFQVQTTPYVGSKTLYYPISYYLEENISAENPKPAPQLCNFSVPALKDKVSNVVINPVLSEAFHWIPGRILRFAVEGSTKKTVTWEVMTNAYNQTFLYCAKTKSSAFFINDGVTHYFTTFQGNKKSLLYYFYIGLNKVLLGFYKNLTLQQRLPLDSMHNGIELFAQDFIAPFLQFLQKEYTIQYLEVDNEVSPKKILLHTQAKKLIFKQLQKTIDFEILLENRTIFQYVIKEKGKIITLNALTEAQVEKTWWDKTPEKL